MFRIMVGLLGFIAVTIMMATIENSPRPAITIFMGVIIGSFSFVAIKNGVKNLKTTTKPKN